MTGGIVSAPQPEAVEAGADALRKGGNAIDAAVACALVQTAVDPQMCGIAGFGSMQLYLPERGEHLFLDFHGRAPSQAREDMWEDLIVTEAEDGFGFILKGWVNDIGYGAITTPMTLRALDEALKRYGTMSLGALMEPAIHYAEQGMLVRPHINYYWNSVEPGGKAPHSMRLTENPEARKIYVKDDGSLYKLGQTVRNPDMGRTYRRIVEAGVDEFYTGEIGRQIVADMAANGGLLTAEDLEDAAPAQIEPL
jgi:gamma-glutamyltranspeptidase / glutathione hydrolase